MDQKEEIKQEVVDGSSSIVKDDRGFVSLKFQLGPLKENGINGTTIEYVIKLLINRLRGFQRGQYRCRENACAITKLEEARMWLDYRTKKRFNQGVEGYNKPHDDNE